MLAQSYPFTNFPFLKPKKMCVRLLENYKETFYGDGKMKIGK